MDYKNFSKTVKIYSNYNSSIFITNTGDEWTPNFGYSWEFWLLIGVLLLTMVLSLALLCYFEWKFIRSMILRLFGQIGGLLGPRRWRPRSNADFHWDNSFEMVRLSNPNFTYSRPDLKPPSPPPPPRVDDEEINGQEPSSADAEGWTSTTSPTDLAQGGENDQKDVPAPSKQDEEILILGDKNGNRYVGYRSDFKDFLKIVPTASEKRSLMDFDIVSLD